MAKDEAEWLGWCKAHKGQLGRVVKMVGGGDEVEMLPGGRGLILFYYWTARKYRQWSEKDNDDLRVIYNRPRTITVRITNLINDSVEALHHIDIVPCPDRPSVELEFYRPYD